MRPVVNYIDLPNHVTLPFVEQGSSSGVPLVLLHGVTDSWRSFELVLPHLPESIHAFALTQRGHGDASRPDTGYRLHELASDVAAFMDVVKIESAVIAGHSMGSGVAQRFATRYPDRTLGLVLIGSFASLQDNPGVQEIWDSPISTMTDPVDKSFVQEFQQSTLAQPVAQEYFEAVVEECLKLLARVWRAAFEGFLQEGFSEELNEVEVPTLIVWGDQDAFCGRSDQDRLTSAIKGSQLLVYKGAGHALHWEEPERFASDLTAFIEENFR